MDLALYRARSGVYVAVPDCLQPAVELERRLGPMRFLRRLRLSDGHARHWARLAPELDAHDYALLSADEVARLLQPASDAQGTAAGQDPPDTTGSSS